MRLVVVNGVPVDPKTLIPLKVDLSKLSLTKVKFHEDMSEETPCFSGVLLEDGVKVANVSNRGHGGCNDYDTYGINTDINPHERYGGIDADCHIMGLAEDYNMATLYQSNALVLKKGDNVSTVKWKGNPSINKMKRLVHDYPTWIKNQVRQYEAQGYTILNRNL